MSRERRPASRCTTGIPAKNPARAPVSAELVSPWTTTSSGLQRPNSAARTCNRDDVSPPTHGRSRTGRNSTPGSNPNPRKVSATIAPCCPVEMMFGLAQSECPSKAATGASLMASGRVPTTKATAGRLTADDTLRMPLGDVQDSRALDPIPHTLAPARSDRLVREILYQERINNPLDTAAIRSFGLLIPMNSSSPVAGSLWACRPRAMGLGGGVISKVRSSRMRVHRTFKRRRARASSRLAFEEARPTDWPGQT